MDSGVVEDILSDASWARTLVWSVERMLLRLEVSRCWTGDARALAMKAGNRNEDSFMLLICVSESWE